MASLLKAVLGDGLQNKKSNKMYCAIDQLSVIVLLGPPGAGKTTQAEILSRILGFIHISTGGLLRKEIANDTAIGKLLKPIMASGSLAPEAIVDQLLSNQLNSLKRDEVAVLDGYPRSYEQAKELDDKLNLINKKVSFAIALSVTTSILLDRIQTRAGYALRDDDANLPAIENRIERYDMEIAKLTAHYQSQGTLITLSGEGSIEDINRQLVKNISK